MDVKRSNFEFMVTRHALLRERGCEEGDARNKCDLGTGPSQKQCTSYTAQRPARRSDGARARIRTNGSDGSSTGFLVGEVRPDMMAPTEGERRWWWDSSSSSPGERNGLRELERWSGALPGAEDGDTGEVARLRNGLFELRLMVKPGDGRRSAARQKTNG
jgi:hypothetical protein